MNVVQQLSGQGCLLGLGNCLYRHWLGGGGGESPVWLPPDSCFLLTEVHTSGRVHSYTSELQYPNQKVEGWVQIETEQKKGAVKGFHGDMQSSCVKRMFMEKSIQ